MPGVVTGAVVPLYVAAVTGALARLVAPGTTDIVVAQVPNYTVAIYYGLYVGLAFALQQRQRWARTALSVLAVIGILLAVHTAWAWGLAFAIPQAGWPVAYLILINTPTAKAWFRRRRPAGPPADAASAT
jgi:hypothetical protein